MEFVIIDTEVLETLLARIDNLAEMATVNHQRNDKGLNQWLNNQDVCHILNVNKRTLQNFRNTGALSYSKIAGVVYYKPEDVEKLLTDSKIPRTWK